MSTLPHRPSHGSAERTNAERCGASGEGLEVFRPSRGTRAGRFKPSGPLFLAAGLAAVIVLIAGARTGAGQQKSKPQGPPEKAPAQWTVGAHDKTNFPLVGMHRTLNCRDCHINNVFEGTPKTCEVCHWERRQDDRYRLRLGTRCEDCHTPESWKKVPPNKWNHETITGFKLEGAHQFLDCAECHGASGFQALPAACFACHERDYRSVGDPNHVTANFPTDCTQCHNTRTWGEATFTHTAFVLRGAHLRVDCSACHKDGVYAGTPTTCVSCHLADYNSTTDPNHRANSYSTECQNCHGTGASSWGEADDLAIATLALRHEFPIGAGKHAGLACSDCHTTSSYRQFNCLDCHAHDKLDMDKKHRGVAGYAYSSQGCFACHPRGTR